MTSNLEDDPGCPELELRAVNLPNVPGALVVEDDGEEEAEQHDQGDPQSKSLPTGHAVVWQQPVGVAPALVTQVKLDGGGREENINNRQVGCHWMT